MAEPSNYPEWATSPAGGDIVEPIPTKKASGWRKVLGVPEKPPYQQFNWWMNLVYQWIKHLKEEAVTFTGLKTFSSGIATDTIAEKTSAAGVTADGVLLKDNNASIDRLLPKTPGAGLLIGEANSTAMQMVEGYARIKSPLQTTIAAGNYTFDASTKHIFLKTGGTGTFTINNLEEGQTVNIVVSSTGSGYTITWAGQTFRWKGAVVPTPTTTGSRYDVYTFVKIAGVVYGVAILDMG